MQKHEKYRTGNTKNHEQQKIIGPLKNLKICKNQIEYSQIKQNSHTLSMKFTTYDFFNTPKFRKKTFTKIDVLKNYLKEGLVYKY